MKPTQHWLERRAYVNAQKDVPCTDCGGRFPHYVMHFDHLPQYVKVISIGTAVSTRGWKVLLEELKKCEIVCANCHAERTWRRLHAPEDQPARPEQMRLFRRISNTEAL